MSEEEVVKELSLEEKVQKQQSIIEEYTLTLQKMSEVLNEQRRLTQDCQTVLSSLIRTIQDNRQLNVEQLKESHWLIVGERVNGIFNGAVQNGVLKRVDAIGPKSLVLVQEFTASGVEVNRCAEFQMEKVQPEYQELFLNKPVGEKVALFQDGQLKSTFIVQDIFEENEQVTQNLS